MPGARSGTENDPSVAINPFVAAKADSIGNFTNFDDPEMQAWAAEASATDDFEVRKELYSQIMTKINNEGLTWYSGGTAVMIAHAPGIEGFNTWTLPDGTLGAGIAPEAQTRWYQVFITE